MTVQTLKIGKQEFIVIAKRDFQKLAAKAQQQTEDEYWTEAALRAEAEARDSSEESIPFEVFERQLDSEKRVHTKRARRRHR